MSRLDATPGAHNGEAPLPDTVVHFCAACQCLIGKPDQAFCTKDGQKRPEDGWPSMKTCHIAHIPAPNPKLFLSPEGDLHIFPGFLGSGARVELDETTANGVLTIKDGRRFAFSVVRSGEMVEVGLDPLLNPDLLPR